MGLVFINITPQGAREGRIMSKPMGGFRWIVGRWEKEDTPDGPKWKEYHIQGVADTEEIAITMCVSEDYFIGPVPANTLLAHETIEWVGLYFPLRKI